MTENQFTRSLPDEPNFENLIQEAESLLRDFSEGKSEAVSLVAHHEPTIESERFEKLDARRVLAKSYGFPSWSMLRERLAVEATKKGDRAALSRIIASVPDVPQFLATKISVDRPTNHAIGKDATLLQLAAIRTRKGGDTASLLIEAGAKVDIHSACGLGKIDKIREILSDNPDAVSSQVDTYYPIQYSITAARVESIECLMQRGDDPNKDLKKVAYFGWEDDVVDSEYTPWKPIHMASLWGFDDSRVPVADCLAKHGADLNAVSPLDGYRPIHLVAMPNRVAMIRFFIDLGVDVDSRSQKCVCFPPSEENGGPVTGFECTPLMIACGEGFVEATQCLIELGADVNARNEDGKSALDFASKRFWNGQPYDEVIQLLKNAGAT